MLSSRLLGVLKPVNGGQEYALTMLPHMAISRVRALADLLAPVVALAGALTEPMTAESAKLAAESHSLYQPEQAAPETAVGTAAPDFAAFQSEVVRELQSSGLSNPRVISKRLSHVASPPRGLT